MADQPAYSDRGFAQFDQVPSEYGGYVRVYESSAAEAPHIWLRAVAPINLNRPDGPTVEAPIHLTLENAAVLARQILWLVEHHYQGEQPHG